MKKGISALIIVLALMITVSLMLFSGCGQPAEPTEEAVAPAEEAAEQMEEPAEEAATPGEKKVVTFTLNNYDGVDPGFYVDFETGFEEANPDIDLNLITLPWSELEPRLQTMIAGGEPPDLAHIGTRMLLNYIDLDLAEPIEDWLSDDLANDIIEGTKEAEIGGVLWGMPLVAAPRIFFYRTDIVSEAPETFEEMKEIAQEVSNPPDMYGVGMTGRAPYVELTEFVYYFYGADGDFFETAEDGGYGKCTVNSEAGVKALTFMKSLVDEELTQPTVLADWRDEVLDLYIAGKIAMYPTGAFLEAMLQGAEVEFPYEFTTMPYFEDAQNPTTLMVTDTIMMFNTSEVKAEASKVLDFMFQPEWVEKYSRGHGFPGPTHSSAELEYFQSPIFQVLNEASVNSKGWPLIAEWTECNDIIWAAIGDVYANDTDPQAALDEAAKKIDELRGIE